MHTILASQFLIKIEADYDVSILQVEFLNAISTKVEVLLLHILHDGVKLSYFLVSNANREMRDCDFYPLYESTNNSFIRKLKRAVGQKVFFASSF